ncbi:hypothetical protein HJD18_11945 [Thermoleophilia bacterium SCSIO 60948]|nr:hypothetical protein HJD18_11945 [Thermoleophilia bacterium SCSIO 60948]
MDPPPPTRFAEALASVGGGSGATGVGWVEPALVAPGPGRIELIGDALGPNASSVVESAPVLERRFGLDPLAAETLVSTGGSYAFGLRLDGVDGSGLARELRSGRTAAEVGDEVELLDADSYASVPEPLLAAGVRGLGAFDAVGKQRVVLAISERSRSALLGEGEPRIDAAVYAAAAECLGEVVAAKLTPDSNIVSTDLGVSLVAAGVRADGREVLCTLGGDAELAAEIEANLRRLLTPDGSDPISGEPLGDQIAAVDVDRGAPYGVEAARAVIDPAPREAPGYVFRLVSGAGVVGLINGEGRTFEPFGDEVGSAGDDG